MGQHFRALLNFRRTSVVLLFASASVVRAGGANTDEQLCEQTGGTWEPLAYGDYYCGFAPECAAIIPGCDCGPGANFQDGSGCVVDEACSVLYPVQVILDMDAVAPGIQSSVTVTSCTTVVENVAVYVVDPLGGRELWGIGYLGGLERGISFGHMPGENQGSVADMAGWQHTPVNPGGTGWVDHAPYFDPGFIGPEVQYVEWGAESPAMIPSEPAWPILTADITLEGAAPGDVFDFYLLDRVRVWIGGDNGCFSAMGPYSLDSGGDAVPDGTDTLFGLDPDPPVAVPPAAYTVDYIDGPPGGGPAVIQVVAQAADLNASNAVDAADLAALLGAWGVAPGNPADMNGDNQVNSVDLALLLGAWGGCR